MSSESAPQRPSGDAEKTAWRDRQQIRRSYADLVVARIEALGERFDLTRTGALSYDPARYPLFLLKSRAWTGERPTVLITGGVHGYETSGVLGALSFLETVAADYADRVNIACVPCVSPWGFETINRWNPLTLDPNRSFFPNSPAEESANLMRVVAELDASFLMHMDLHETTDTDNTVFRPDRAARDGVEEDLWHIPDGFYTVGDTANPQPGFQKAVIDAVREETHIAPPDEEGRIIGKAIEQEGVINYDVKALHLCTGFTNATYCTTTEVYPDSPQTNAAECARAQMAAVRGGLDYALGQ